MLPVLRRNAWLSPSMNEGVATLASEMDSIFDRFFGHDGSFTNPAWAGYPVAVWEDEDRVYIEVDVPGLTDKDVEVTVHNGVVFIRGERRREEGRKLLHDGRSYERFQREITLPASVDADHVKATLTSGVLRIELSKTPESKPRKIDVQAS